MSVKHWLDSLSLSQYLELFLSSGIDTLAKCTSLTEADLDRMGVTLPGHKKRILSHLQTALHFSKRNQEETTSKDQQQPIRDRSSAMEVDLIDLSSPGYKNSPDYVNLTAGDTTSCPISLPPKQKKKTDLDELLGLSKGDGGVESDKKRPVPLPRTSVRLNPPEEVPKPLPGDGPKPLPRGRKPTIKEIAGVTESFSSTDSDFKLSNTSSDIQKSVGLEQAPASNKAVVTSEKEVGVNEETAHQGKILYNRTDCSRKLGNCNEDVYEEALPVREPSMASGNSGYGGKLSELDPSFSSVHSPEEADHFTKPLITTEPEGLNSGTVSPDIAVTSTGSARLPMPDYYEGDIDESSSGSDFVNIASFLHSNERCDGEVAHVTDSSFYSGVWNMSSGKAARHYRNEIKSDVSFDGMLPRAEDDDNWEDNDVNVKNTSVTMPPPLLVPDVTLVSRPAPPVPSAPRPPAVPARRESPNDIPPVLQHRKNPSTASAKLLLADIERDVSAASGVSPSIPEPKRNAEVRLPEKDAPGVPKLPPHSVPPTPDGSTEEGVKYHPPFPTPPLHSARIPFVSGIPDNAKVDYPAIPILPVRSAPIPPVEGGTSVHSPVPVPAVRAAPIPPAEGGISVHSTVPVPAAPSPRVEVGMTAGHQIRKPPVRVAPMPPAAPQLEDRTAVQPPIPAPPSWSAPPPPVPRQLEDGTGVKLPILMPPVRPAPVPPSVLLDVKIPAVSTPVVQAAHPMPAARGGVPPRPPPKVSVPSSEGAYYLAEEIDDDLFGDPEPPGDGMMALNILVSLYYRNHTLEAI